MGAGDAHSPAPSTLPRPTVTAQPDGAHGHGGLGPGIGAWRRRSARRMAVRGGRYSRGQAHCQEDPDRLPRRTYPSQVDAGLAFTLAVELVLVKGLRGAVGSTPLGRMGARGRRARMPTWCMTTSTIACTMARRSSAPQMTGMLARSRRPSTTSRSSGRQCTGSCGVPQGEAERGAERGVRVRSLTRSQVVRRRQQADVESAAGGVGSNGVVNPTATCL